ncbi:uncharacterized protein LOC143289224 [Babylonia areolata]|uniref:uncharacterized protein LOC143289224 n=1 Tax=Babylonia areolata TaxID=304850 RepID=UPI003FD6A9D7
METSETSRSAMDGGDAGSFQRTVQSKAFHSLLASTPTGKMPSSAHGLSAANLECDTSSAGNTDKQIGATVGHAVSMEDDFCADRICAKDTDVLHTRGKNCCRLAKRAEGVSKRPNVAKLYSITVIFCFCSVALGFCIVQTVLKDYDSLRRDYQALRDDFQKLRNEFDTYRLQNQMGLDTTEKDDLLSTSNDRRMQFTEPLLQILRSNGVAEKVSTYSGKRAKRSLPGQWDPIIRLVRREVHSYIRALPKVHLKGMGNVSIATDYTDSMNQYLVWQSDPDSFSSRGVELTHEYNDNNRVKAIQILHAGIYVVYSQVVINGTTNTARWRRDCTHQTVELRYHSDNYRDDVTTPPQRVRVLMSGFLTQDEKGLYVNDTITHPRDSSLQIGVFRLFRQSQIRVAVPSTRDCRFTQFMTDPTSSYFGLFRIA